MWGFGSDLKAGKTYSYNFIVHAAGLTGRHGRDMLYDGTAFDTARPDDDRRTLEARLKAEAVEAARKELPRASRYVILKFEEI